MTSLPPAPYNGAGNTMYLLAPTPTQMVLRLMPSLFAEQEQAPQTSQSPPPTSQGQQGQTETQVEVHRVRRIPLPSKPPFRFRLKLGPMIPSDPATRDDTGFARLRVEADVLPFTAQRGAFRGALTFVTLGCSDGIGADRTLRAYSLSISQRTTLPLQAQRGQTTRSGQPSRFAYGGGLDVWALDYSGAGSSETKLALGTDAAAEYLVGRNVFVQAKYDFLLSGLQGYHIDGPSVMVGRRF